MYNQYNLKKSVERFIWRFKTDEKGNRKVFNPNDNDLQALKTIVNWIDRQKKEVVNNNQLFAKLYIYHLCDITRKFETTVLDGMAQKELSKTLDLPLNYFYKAFERDLFSNQFNKFLENGGKKQDGSNVDLKDFQELYHESYIEVKLNEMISEALNRFS